MMLGSNNTALVDVNGTTAPITQSVGNCYLPGGPPVEWQRSFRFYTSAAGLPVSLVLCITCLAANAMILVGNLRGKKLKDKPRIIIVCSLALSDFFLGVIMVYSLWSMVHKIILDGGCVPRNAALSKLYHVGYHVCFVSSIGSLMLMSLDCYLCVSRPLMYRSIVSTSGVLKSVFVLWLLVAIYTTVYMESSRAVRTAMISIISALLAMPIIIFQILTYASYRSHNSAVADQFTSTEVQTRNAANERKIAISVAYLLSTLVIGYFPRIVTPFISAAVGFKVHHMMVLSNTIALLGCAAARPIVTYMKNADVRRGIRALFRRESSSLILANRRPPYSLPQAS